MPHSGHTAENANKAEAGVHDTVFERLCDPDNSKEVCLISDHKPYTGGSLHCNSTIAQKSTTEICTSEHIDPAYTLCVLILLLAAADHLKPFKLYVFWTDRVGA